MVLIIIRNMGYLATIAVWSRGVGVLSRAWELETWYKVNKIQIIKNGMTNLMKYKGGSPRDAVGGGR